MSRRVPIPARMRHLEVDRRGYAIPWGVYRDPAGTPHFTINDETRRQKIINDDLCGICATKLFRGRWFVGGPLSAFDPQGCYIDPPMHRDCLEYAMTACPYLAAPSYDKRIDDATLRKSGQATPLLVEQTMLPGRPEVFVAIMAIGQTVHWNGIQSYLSPKRPYHRVEFWRFGTVLPQAEGAALVAEIIARPTPEKRQPRFIPPNQGIKK